LSNFANKSSGVLPNLALVPADDVGSNFKKFLSASYKFLSPAVVKMMSSTVEKVTGAGGDAVFQENAMIVTTSYTLTTAKSASSVGPITINSGVAVTIGAGQRWVIL
jgi:hypothetical protein